MVPIFERILAMNVEIFGTVKVVTDEAVLLNEGDKDVWLPLSQIETEKQDFMVGDDILVFVPFWLAEEKGLI